MQSESTREYIKRLLKDGQKWQYTDIWEREEKPRFYFTKTQYIIIAISILTTLYLNKGFPESFVNYVMTTLSIFVGLFLTLILSAFDKFKALPKIERPTYDEQDYLKTRKNFFKQFTSLTAYAIVLSLLCIVLLGIVSLSSSFNDCLLNYPYAAPTKENVLRLLKVLLKSIYNGVIIYFLLDFLIIVFYAVTSIHAYMQVEFNKNEAI